jgi:hypothetical protein
VLLAAQLVTAAAPAAHAQSGSPCDDLRQQIDAINQDLDQLKNDSLPLLFEAQQLAAVAPSETQVIASEGVSPLLTPETAGLYGAAAATVGAEVGSWQAVNGTAASAAYVRDLAITAFNWYSTFIGLTAPVQGFVPSLSGLASTLANLQLLGTKAQADLGQRDAFSQALQDCTARGGGPAGGGDPAVGGAVCSVGGQDGFSNSQCFGLALDAATAVWTACTEAYFAAEREVFRTGGDLPINTCDGELKSATDAIQETWGHP